MFVRSVLSTALVLATSTVAAAPVHAAVLRTPDECASSLDCSARELDTFAAAERLFFLRKLEATQASRLVPDGARWRNIEGVLEFFHERGLVKPGGWVSLVDAAILEGIERGTAIALGMSQDTFGNPGSTEWASYLRRLQDGELTQRSVHDAAWSRAEQASTEHGLAMAAARGVRPSAAEWRFYQFSQVYRWALRNEPGVLLALGGPLVPPRIRELRVPFLTWFTDVRNPVPAYRGSAMAWSLSGLDPVGGAFNAITLLLAYLPSLFEDFTRYGGRLAVS
jgi:hypothetical protein